MRIILLVSSACMLAAQQYTIRDGNVYIAEFEFDRIRKISTSGIITTIAGGVCNPCAGFIGDGGPATSAQMWGPARVLHRPVHTSFRGWLAQNSNPM